MHNDLRKPPGSDNPPHWMLREVYEQPAAIRETVRRNLSGDSLFGNTLNLLGPALTEAQRIIIAASGSSRHAGLAAEIMIEDLSGVPVDVEYSSEYCSRSARGKPESLVMVITQSGETADTLSAQREAQIRGAKTIAISNVADTTITREATVALHTYAGMENAIPATKSFTSQLAILYLFALHLAQITGRLRSAGVQEGLKNLDKVASAMEASLAHWQSSAEHCARDCRDAKAFLFLGRNIHYAIAREGALKLKEISYVHAEGLPAGELRHGPNALVDENLPVVVLAARDDSDAESVLRYKKTLSVIENVKSRGGRTIVIANADDTDVPALADHLITVPAVPELLLPILEVVPLQLFAYFFALFNGRDVDNPRNLVKAVTVE